MNYNSYQCTGKKIHINIYFEQEYYTGHGDCRLRIFKIIRAPLRKVKEGRKKTERKLRRKRREKTDRGRDPKTVS